jgi:hypothetical protein
MSDVIAEQLRSLMPIRRAARCVQERDIVGVGQLLGGCSGKLAELNGQHGGAHRVLKWLPGSEVGRDRECANDLRSADRPLRRARHCCDAPDVLCRHITTLLLLSGKQSLEPHGVCATCGSLQLASTTLLSDEPVGVRSRSQAVCS